MRRFIRYLYEYEQETKMRNVGFVKVEQDMEQCVIHVHGKGFRMEEQTQGLEVYLFWDQEGKCVGIHQGVTEPPAPGLNYQLCFTPEDMREKGNYDLVNGIILKDGNGHWYAAVWNDDVVNVCQMTKWEMPEDKIGEAAGVEEEKEKTRAEMPDVESGNRAEMPDAGERNRAETLDVEDRNRAETPDAGERNRAETSDAEEEKVRVEAGDVEEGKNRTKTEDKEKEEARVEAACEEEQTTDSKSGYKVRKIQRKDMVCLPRCEWKHANNSFLIHGYYNYHHLILTVRDGQLKLGVPGVYHPQEARAAESFGFPEFLPVEETELTLTEEEKNDREKFGYWCRNVRGPESCAEV